jgi:hypothetical protein
VSLVIWYKVEIGQAAPSGGPGGILAASNALVAAASVSGLGLPITASNDLFAGSLVLDADVEVKMTEGAAADTFEVTLVNLPTRTTELIRAVRASGALSMSVHLGYFDEPSLRDTDASLVLTGQVTRVTGTVGPDGLARTTLYGQEEAGYRLLRKSASLSRSGPVPAIEIAQGLLNGTGVSLAGDSTLPVQLTDFTVQSGSTLDALAGLAAKSGVAYVVRDGQVFLGAAVGRPADTTPMDFDPDTNIVSLDATNGEDSEDQPDRPVRDTVELVVLGHPGLRVGQVGKITGLSGVPTGLMRVSQVVHRFGTGTGYVAHVRLVVAGPGQRAQITTGVQGAVNRVRDVIDRTRDDHPAIDVGEVTGYASGADGKHLATMHYGQSPAGSVVKPSVASPVNSTVDLNDMSIASAFAFDRTGLMVPVYPKMRALLAHNRGLVSDAVVAGFVWPETPLSRRPPNEPGDYWLALPTGLDADGLPTGPGVNDLTDAKGRRVIQAAGLHIVVGTDALPDVGTRPEPPQDNTITIEHAAGTTITIAADGAVTITTDSKPITLTNGSVSLALDGSTVAVS